VADFRIIGEEFKGVFELAVHLLGRLKALSSKNSPMASNCAPAVSVSS
jgi:hypothetical protein